MEDITAELSKGFDRVDGTCGLLLHFICKTRNGSWGSTQNLVLSVLWHMGRGRNGRAFAFGTMSDCTVLTLFKKFQAGRRFL